MKHTRSQCCTLCGNALGSGAAKRIRRKGFGICFKCKAAGPRDEHRCSALTMKQTRCARFRMSDSDVCMTHKRVKR